MGDETVIDARGRFSREQPRSVAPARDAAEDLHAKKSILQRLREADDVLERLKATVRVPHEDRPIFASNLGRMLERSLGADARKLLPQIFEKAFGALSGESHFKKRKRLIRFDGEGQEPGGQNGSYVAYGHDYARLAIEIGRHAAGTAEATQEDPSRAAVLRLIEGSSFDDRRGIAQRYEAEQEAELLRRLSQIVSRIEAAVDLDRLRAWCQRQAIGARCRQFSGELVNVSLLDDTASLGWGSRLDISDDQLGVAFESRLSPSVRVATLCTRFPEFRVLPLEILPGEISALGERGAAKVAFARAFSVAGEGIEWLIDTGELPDGSDIETIGDHPGWISSGSLPEGVPVPWFGREVDLQLRFDPLADRWRLCVCLENRGLHPDHSFWMEPSRVFCGDSRRSVINHKMEHSIEYIVPQSWGDVFICRYGAKFFAFEIDPSLYPLLQDNLSAGTLLLPGKRSLDLLFLRSGSLDEGTHRLQFDIEDCAGHFSPAPHDTIAGALLRNLAYAEPSQRVDNLLLADAKARSKKVWELAEQSESEYVKSIEVFESGR